MKGDAGNECRRKRYILRVMVGNVGSLEGGEGRCGKKGVGGGETLVYFGLFQEWKPCVRSQGTGSGDVDV